MLFAKYMLIEKNACFFYILKKASSNMAFPSTWYSDTVYSDHVLRMHAFGKHFPRL